MYPYVLVLSTKVNRNDPKSNSLINIFPSVEYHERETYEMLGVYFIGHPRNERFFYLKIGLTFLHLEKNLE